jgi:hypothetical protein
VTVNVKDPNEVLAQSFAFSPATDNNGDFERIGILGTLGETIGGRRFIVGHSPAERDFLSHCILLTSVSQMV